MARMYLASAFYSVACVISAVKDLSNFSGISGTRNPSHLILIVDEQLKNYVLQDLQLGSRMWNLISTKSGFWQQILTPKQWVLSMHGSRAIWLWFTLKSKTRLIPALGYNFSYIYPTGQIENAQNNKLLRWSRTESEQFLMIDFILVQCAPQLKACHEKISHEMSLS